VLDVAKDFYSGGTNVDNTLLETTVTTTTEVKFQSVTIIDEIKYKKDQK
jgi:hypothetical protein